ncbi:MAG: response regulator [Muribaculaceae bacterium]|nr:response regulator [Muribaculaceae bacterium]
MENKKKILVVDDKSVIAKVVSMYLKEYDCIYHSSALQSIKWLANNDLPGLIVTDLRMPEMSGREFLKYLKSNEFYKNIPVIILSSEDSTSDRIKLLEEGAVDYIVKPFNPVELKMRIKNVLMRE